MHYGIEIKRGKRGGNLSEFWITDEKAKIY